ncbi:hypothetical protein XU18_4744 [Perkinsela sp. CCAP 1560/4]|nr:hypothetical protein XU18_4744 [Perkinsela sp. CCAP 1560/4]|eukprot:KNH03936.1 hypothetical protein XU18_4744 [Perkinsela sp. CCAP 1560/4]
MVQLTTILLGKKPVIRSKSKGKVSKQLKSLLNKPTFHPLARKWEELSEYPPRRLTYCGVHTGPNGEVKYDPHRESQTYFVPDQDYYKIPVPAVMKDAYWNRELLARKTQINPWDLDMQKRAWDKDLRDETDFQYLAFRKKFQFSVRELLDQATKERR